MSRNGRRLQIDLSLDSGADAAEWEDATRALRDELLRLNVDAVELPSAEAPPATRAGEISEIGTLIVSLGPELLGAVARVIAGWLRARSGRRVVLELDGDRIDASGMSADDQRQLIDAFVARHSPG